MEHKKGINFEYRHIAEVIFVDDQYLGGLRCVPFKPIGEGFTRGV